MASDVTGQADVLSCEFKVLSVFEFSITCFIQVSHHPPTLATHTDGRGWTLWQEFTMTTKFRGRYLQIIPMGQFCFVCVCVQV